MVVEQRKPTSEGTSIFDRFPELRGIPKDRYPQNIFIIPDGNGRWAASNGLTVSIGHKRGADVIAQAFRDFNDLKDHIPFVGVWGFSVDNLNRPKSEVDFLMNLSNDAIRKFQPELIKRNNRFIHIGRKDILPPTLNETIIEAEEATKNNPGQVVYIAIGFGGEDQELRIAQKVAERARIDPKLEITRALIESLRDGNGEIPPADLIIRSSGEHRLSDVGWIQGKRTELFFEKKHFPGFNTGDFVRAIVDFSKRERRFGGRSQAQLAS